MLTDEPANLARNANQPTKRRTWCLRIGKKRDRFSGKSVAFQQYRAKR